MNILKLLFLSLTVILIPVSAYAYIDPGTGGIIVQVILGGIGGLVLFFKLYWKKVKSWFSKESEEEIVTSSDDQNDHKKSA